MATSSSSSSTTNAQNGWFEEIHVKFGKIGEQTSQLFNIASEDNSFVIFPK